MYVYFIQEQRVIGSARQTSRHKTLAFGFFSKVPQVATKNMLYQEIMMFSDVT